jgi:hypothetical protein
MAKINIRKTTKKSNITTHYRKKIDAILTEITIDEFGDNTGYVDPRRIYLTGYPRYLSGLTPRAQLMVDILYKLQEKKQALTDVKIPR